MHPHSIPGVPCPVRFAVVLVLAGCGRFGFGDGSSTDAGGIEVAVDELRYYDRVLTQTEITALAAP